MIIKHIKEEKTEKYIAMTGDLLITSDGDTLLYVYDKDEEYALINLTENWISGYYNSEEHFYVGCNLSSVEGYTTITKIIRSDKANLIFD